MKYALFCLIILAACSTPDVTKYSHEDSLFMANYIDSANTAIKKVVLLDTNGLYDAPIRVLKSRIVQNEYSSYKSVSLSYKNVSPKKIVGIKFSWYGENVNVFKEPAKMGNMSNLIIEVLQVINNIDGIPKPTEL